jgi:hypothetical protein
VAVDAVLGVAAGFLAVALYMLAQITITGKLDMPSTTADSHVFVSLAAVFASPYLDATLQPLRSLQGLGSPAPTGRTQGN